MMSFALSLDDLVLASFVSGPGSTTLPMEVFSAVRLGVKPEINAVASLILLSVSLFTFFAWYFTRQAEGGVAGRSSRRWKRPRPTGRKARRPRPEPSAEKATCGWPFMARRWREMPGYAP